MRPKKPILLYCADRELLSATAFALRLQPYDVTAVDDSRSAAAVMMASELVCGILIHARQGDLAGRLIHRLLEADLHIPVLLVDRAGDLAPVRYADMVSVWPQYLNGSYPRRPQRALRAQTRPTAPECGMSELVYIGGFSGGIDSQAAARFMLNRYGAACVVLVNADAGGNEHPLTVEHIDWYSEHMHPVVKITAKVGDFRTQEWCERKGVDAEADLTFPELRVSRAASHRAKRSSVPRL